MKNKTLTKLAKSTWYERVPKVELHLHLEGAIPLDALWQLVQKYSTDPSVTDIHSLEQKFQYKDFPHFIQTWIWKNQFLREYDDFTFVAEAVAKIWRVKTSVMRKCFTLLQTFSATASKPKS